MQNQMIQHQNNSLSNNLTGKGTGIPGFDDIPFSDLPIPYIKLVGENTKDKSLADGNEAQNGEFIHTGKRTAFKSFTFRPLSGSKGTTLKYGKEDHPDNYVPQYIIVAIDEEDNEPFLLALQSSNLNSFRKVLGEMKRLANKGIAPYNLKVTATVQKLSSDQFKWNAMAFNWEVSELDEAKQEIMARLFNQYGNAAKANANNNGEVEIKEGEEKFGEAEIQDFMNEKNETVDGEVEDNSNPNGQPPF